MVELLQLFTPTWTAAHVLLMERAGRGTSLSRLCKPTVVLADVTRGDYPTEIDERRAYRLVCDLEHGREIPEKSASTYPTSSSIRAVNILSPGEDTTAK
jgi:hypothetical protein